MSIGVSVGTTKFAARNNGIGVRQERSPQSPTAYSSVRCASCYGDTAIIKLTEKKWHQQLRIEKQ